MDWIDALVQLRDRRTMAAFCDEILTAAEQRDLALRWRLMALLQAGVPQREIAAQLGISLCKITRGARVLKRKGSVSRRLLGAAPAAAAGRSKVEAERKHA